MNERRGPWTKISSSIAHQNGHYSVRCDQVIKPDGSRGQYHVVQSPGAAFIVPVDADKKIHLIGLHRYTLNRYSIEIPGGGLDSQDPLTAAKRELQEETGLIAKTWKELAVTHPATGIMDETNYIFLATDLTQTAVDEKVDEGIDENYRLSFKEAFARVRRGEICDQQTVTGITLAAIELGLIEV